MRLNLKPLAAITLALMTPPIFGGTASAQQSADAIINALKPSGNLVTGSTRGIRLGGTAAPQAPSAARPVSAPSAAASNARTTAHDTAPAASDPQVAGPSVNLTVNFPTGSAELTPAARASLDSLGKALASSDLASFRFRIEGHTDNVGSREENRALSQRRAEAVVSYMVQCGSGAAGSRRHGSGKPVGRDAAADPGSPQPPGSGHQSRSVRGSLSGCDTSLCSTRCDTR
jgi:OOP family OmpA-OmpF porin